MNRRATLIMWLHNPTTFMGDILLGDAVITYSANIDGRVRDVPQDFVRLLTEPGKFKIEVQTLDNPESWNGNQRIYEDWVEAYSAALSLRDRWLAVMDIRVVVT